MQESNPRSATSTRSRRAGSPRGVVLIVSTNPFALPELTRLAQTAPMRCRPHYLKLGHGADVEDIRVPRASVLVLNSFSTGVMTEKVVAAIRMLHPRASVIVLVNGMGDSQGFALLQLGVKGILNHRDLDVSLGKAIGFVASGGVRMPRGLMARFLDSNFSSSPLLPTPRLSHRERQVLDGVVKGRANKEIADDLHISESTVKFHLARIFRKFHVRKRAELITQNVQELATHVH